MSQEQSVADALFAADMERWMEAGYSIGDAFKAVTGRPPASTSSLEGHVQRTAKQHPNQQHGKKKRLAHHPK